MPEYTLKVISNTFLKVQPISSTEILDPNQKPPIAAGTELLLHSYRYDESTNHYKVAFLFNSFSGKNTWWIFADYVQVLKDGIEITKTPQKFKLKVRWRSQLDNWYEPLKTCNVTSVAMCLDYLGHSQKSGIQLEDELYEYCQDRDLDKHNPLDLAQLVKDYGYKDNFQFKSNWAEVKTWIANGNPAIVHGWFTPAGHILVLIGYNERGWIVNDPNGEWFEEGYDTNASGAGLTYSYKMMERLCSADGELWIHYISK